jgi:poly(A) polymerase
MHITRWVPEPLAAGLRQVAQGQRVWLVGGAVRDRLLNRPEPDMDFVVEGEARALARRYADSIGASYYDLDRERDTGRVVIQAPHGQRRYLDFARMRGSGILQDLGHRDFTINALGVLFSEPEQLLDPTGGLQDLKDRVLRACYPQAIRDDPVRALRAVRIANELGFAIEPRTIGCIRSGALLLGEISAERIRDEIMRMLAADQPGAALRILDRLGLMEVVFPELAALKGQESPMSVAKEPWSLALDTVAALSGLLVALRPEHDAEAVSGLVISQLTSHIGRFRRQISAELEQELTQGRKVRELLFIAALYHPIAWRQPVETQRRAHLAQGAHGLGGIQARARALRLSSSEIERLTRILRSQGGIGGLTPAPALEPRQVYRFLLRTEGAASQVILLSLAIALAGYSPAAPPRDVWLHELALARQLLGARYGQAEVHMGQPELVTGSDLIEALGIQPGPEVGRMLALIREAQAVGDIGTREAALRLAQKELQRKGAQGDHAPPA